MMLSFFANLGSLHKKKFLLLALLANHADRAFATINVDTHAEQRALLRPASHSSLGSVNYSFDSLDSVIEVAEQERESDIPETSLSFSSPDLSGSGIHEGTCLSDLIEQTKDLLKRCHGLLLQLEFANQQPLQEEWLSIRELFYQNLKSSCLSMFFNYSCYTHQPYLTPDDRPWIIASDLFDEIDLHTRLPLHARVLAFYKINLPAFITALEKMLSKLSFPTLENNFMSFSEDFAQDFNAAKQALISNSSANDLFIGLDVFKTVVSPCSLLDLIDQQKEQGACCEDIKIAYQKITQDLKVVFDLQGFNMNTAPNNPLPATKDVVYPWINFCISQLQDGLTNRDIFKIGLYAAALKDLVTLPSLSEMYKCCQSYLVSMYASNSVVSISELDFSYLDRLMVGLQNEYFQEHPVGIYLTKEQQRWLKNVFEIFFAHDKYEEFLTETTSLIEQACQLDVITYADTEHLHRLVDLSFLVGQLFKNQNIKYMYQAETLHSNFTVQQLCKSHKLGEYKEVSKAIFLIMMNLRRAYQAIKENVWVWQEQDDLNTIGLKANHMLDDQFIKTDSAKFFEYAQFIAFKSCASRVNDHNHKIGHEWLQNFQFGSNQRFEHFFCRQKRFGIKSICKCMNDIYHPSASNDHFTEKVTTLYRTLICNRIFCQSSELANFLFKLDSDNYGERLYKKLSFKIVKQFVQQSADELFGLELWQIPGGKQTLKEVKNILKFENSQELFKNAMEDQSLTLYKILTQVYEYMQLQDGPLEMRMTFVEDLKLLELTKKLDLYLLLEFFQLASQYGCFSGGSNNTIMVVKSLPFNVLDLWKKLREQLFIKTIEPSSIELTNYFNGLISFYKDKRALYRLNWFCKKLREEAGIDS